MTELTALDMLLLLAMLLGAGFGFMRGFVQESLSLAAWVGVVAGLKILHDPLSAWLVAHGFLGSGAASVVTFVLIVVICFAGGRMIARHIGRGARRSVLGPLDRILGIGFGAIKGLLAVTLLFLLANLMTDIWRGKNGPRPEWMSKSHSYPLLQASSRFIVDFVEKRREADD